MEQTIYDLKTHQAERVKTHKARRTTSQEKSPHGQNNQNEEPK